MAKEKCVWKLAYTLKVGDSKDEVEYCKTHGHFRKRVLDMVTQKRTGWEKH